MTPIKLLFDMDGTIVDTMTSLGFAAYYPTNYGDSYAKTERRYVHEDFTAYSFTNFPKKEAAKLFRAFESPGVFSKALAYPDAIQTVQYFLNRPESYCVQFVSHFRPDWTLAYREKVGWLIQNFNTAVDKDFIVCKDRRNIVWDVLVDDSLANICQCANPEKCILVPDRPWNQGPLPFGTFRCFDWNEIKTQIIGIGDDTGYFNELRMPEM